MKNIIFILLLLSVFNGYGQVIADPAVSDMKIVSTLEAPVNPALLSKDVIVRIKVPIYNKNLVNSLPSGTCKIKVGLGSKLELDPAFNLSNANTSNYFQWTAETAGGQVMITGDLTAVLPADFTDTLTLAIRGTILGNSTVTTNFLITNHNTTINLSDENGANNNTFLPYTVVTGALPVTFKGFLVRKKQCDILASVYTENEINVSRYELEISTDGIRYETKAQLSAGGLPKYDFLVIADELLKQSAQLFLRVKSVDIDGRYQYSVVKQIAGGCNATAAIKMTLFPNPLPLQQKEIFIELGTGVFNGKYNIQLYDAAGRLVQANSVLLNNTNRIQYKTGHLSAGQYMIQLSEPGETVYPVMKFQQL